MKVILLNAYPMDASYELWKQGLYPSQHLWGIIELNRKPGFECIILKHEKYKLLNKIGKFFNIQFLDQQLRALWLLRKCDMIYAPYAAENTKLIVILKLLGLVSKPVVVMVHQPLFGFNSGNPVKEYFIKKLTLQYDAIVFLSERLKQDLINIMALPPGAADKKLFHLDWGPEEKFYEQYLTPKNPADTDFVISAGHTTRDYDTLIEAFRSINFPLKIYCTPSSMPKTTDIPAHITIYSSEKHLSYFDLLKEYNQARIILIPIAGNFRGTQGLTSMLDVYAMGKPVIITKNPNLDIDIDEAGIGVTVRQGSVEDWKNAVSSILYDYDTLKRMGDNSLALFHKRFNMAEFSNGLAKIFLSVYKEPKR